MDKQHSFQILLAFLSLCICVGSLAILPVTNFVGLSVLEVPEIDFDQAEFEEDFFIATIAVISIVGLLFTKAGVMNLDFQPISLSPNYPPPKHS